MGEDEDEHEHEERERGFEDWDFFVLLPLFSVFVICMTPLRASTLC